MDLGAILSRLKGVIGANKGRSDLNEQRTSLLGEVFHVCPICGQKMTKHRYVSVARAPLTPEKEKDFAAMMDAVRNHNWDLLRRFQEWEPLAADAEVYLIRCADGRFNLAVIYAAYSLSDVNYVIHQEELQESDIPPLAGDWQTV